MEKYVGLDKIVDYVVKHLGNLEMAYLSGDLAKGKDSDVIDLILIGNIDRQFLGVTVEKAQNIIGKKIKYLIYESEEALSKTFGAEDYLLIWEKNESNGS